jgi:uncharacterized protein YkwD
MRFPVLVTVLYLSGLAAVMASQCSAFPAKEYGDGAPEPEPVPRAAITHLEDVEEMIFALTNRVRQEYRLAPLRRDPALRDIAREHSDDMILRRFFAHVNPDGHDAAYRIASAHRRLIGGVGENIWRYASTLEYDDGRRVPAYIKMSSQEIAEKAVDSWMHSPGHRENILRPQFTHLGVGVSIVKGEVTITQNFASARAYLNAGLPARIRPGGRLNLAATSYPPSEPEAEKYDFWLEPDEAPAGESLPITQTGIAIKKGIYRIRFYFRIPDGYMIFMGPRIEVR